MGLLACKGTKEVSSASKTNSSVSSVSNENGKDDETSQSQMADSNGNESEKNDTDPAGVVSQINGSTGAMDNARVSPDISSDDESDDLMEIYQNLQMTDEQINSYEKSMRDFKEAVKRDAHGEMRGTIGNERERQLKKILTEDQWNKYGEWKKNKE